MPRSSAPGCCQIRLKGTLPRPWSHWFGEMDITYDGDGNTLLTGAIADQAALHGLLDKVRDLGLALLEVRVLSRKEEDVTTFVAGSTRPVEATRHAATRKVLLACGSVSSLLYVAITVVGAMRWEGYSSASQTVSELIAIDAPSRPLVASLMIAYDLLLYAFGAGVWQSAGRKPALRVSAAGIIGKEVLGLVVTVFFPLHQRGIEGTLTDAMHAALTAVGVLLMLVAMAFGAVAFGKRLRLYTIATVLVFVACGTLGFLDGGRMAADLPTPWLGVTERINIFAYMLWIAVLAVALLRRTQRSACPGFRPR